MSRKTLNLIREILKDGHKVIVFYEEEGTFHRKGINEKLSRDECERIEADCRIFITHKEFNNHENNG